MLCSYPSSMLARTAVTAHYIQLKNYATKHIQTITIRISNNAKMHLIICCILPAKTLNYSTDV